MEEDGYKQELDNKLTLMGIFCTNTAELDSEGKYGQVVLPKFTKINYSWVPNATWYYRKDSGKLHVHKIRDLSPGDEILVPYYDLTGPTSTAASSCLSTASAQPAKNIIKTSPTADVNKSGALR
jgi:hypothetical protein